MESRKLISQAQFAREVGVTRGAVFLAAKKESPSVYIDPDTRKIDPTHPLNVQYKENVAARNSSNQQAAKLKKSILKELDKHGGVDGVISTIKNEVLSNITNQPKTTAEPKPGDNTAEERSPEFLQPAGPRSNPKNELRGYDPDILKKAVVAENQKSALSNLKIQKEQIKVAELNGDLVRRDHVEKFIGIISGTLSNFFLPLDFRLASTIMDICGINDPEIKLQISDAIAKETTAGLDQIRKNAEAFALSLASVAS